MTLGLFIRQFCSFVHYCVFHFYTLGPDSLRALLQEGKLVQIHLFDEKATQIRKT